jgi:hypothetical protein
MAYDLRVVIAAVGVVGICYVAWEVGQWLDPQRSGTEALPGRDTERRGAFDGADSEGC